VSCLWRCLGTHVAHAAAAQALGTAVSDAATAAASVSSSALTSTASAVPASKPGGAKLHIDVKCVSAGSFAVRRACVVTSLVRALT
jgi:hypothetical protein